MPWRRTAAAAVLAALVAGGCNDDGRDLAPAPEVPDAPLTTSTSTTPSTGAAVDRAEPLSLRSPGLDDGDLMASAHTCDGRDVHPPLVIAGVPPGAAEVAISVVDVDAGGDVHWVVAGLDPTTGRLDAGVVPPGAVEARAEDGTTGWVGPCPPPGEDPHRYVFTLSVTAEPIGLAPGLPGREAIEIIDAAAIEVDRYTLRYGRQA